MRVSLSRGPSSEEVVKRLDVVWRHIIVINLESCLQQNYECLLKKEKKNKTKNLLIKKYKKKRKNIQCFKVQF